MHSSTKALLCLLAALPSVHAVTLILGDTSGNPRGSNALDIQTTRLNSTEVASGSMSIAIGWWNNSSAVNSTAIGVNNYAQGDEAIAIGDYNMATQYASVALGYSNLALEADSTAVGSYNEVHGLGHAFGLHNLVLSEGLSPNWLEYHPSGAFGAENLINSLATDSFVFGKGNTLSAANTTVFGSGITNSTAGSTMIGPSDTAKVTILSSGNVGIGTPSPTQKLTVAGAVRIINSTNAARYVDFSVDGNGYMSLGNTVLTGTLGAGNGYYNLHSYGPVVGNASGYFFSSGTNAVSGSQDTGLYRLGAGVLGVGNATVGNASGTLVVGKIGIGVNPPSAALEVAGDIKTTGSFLFKGLQTGSVAKPLRITNWYDMESLVIRHESTTNLADYKISFRDSANGLETLSYGRSGVGLDTSTTSFNIWPAPAQTADLFRVNTNAFKVTASGNVGIGAPTPQAALQIQAPTNVDGGKALRVVDSGFPATPANSSSPAVGQVQFSPVVNNAAVVSLGRRSVGATSTDMELGTLLFNGTGTDGATFRKGATITAVAKTNSWGNSSAPTDLAFSVNSGTGQMEQMTEVMRINSDKSVGIGTATPGANNAGVGKTKLDVVGTGGTNIVVQDTTSYASLGAAGQTEGNLSLRDMSTTSGNQVWNLNSNDGTLSVRRLSDNYSSVLATPLTITSGNMVNVNGALTTSALFVGGSPVLTSTGNGSGLTSLNATQVASGTLNAARLPVEAVQLTSTQTLTNKTLAGAVLTGNTTLGGSTASQQAVITSTGFLGINTNAPADYIHIKTHSGLRDGGITLQTHTDNQAEIRFQDSGGTYRWAVGFTDGPTSKDFHIANSHALHVAPALTVKNSNQNVGIGTTAPAAKLDVNGAVQIAGDVKVKNNGVIRVSPAGDIGMGDFTSGTNPSL